VQPLPYMARGASAHTAHGTCPSGHMTCFEALLGRPLCLLVQQVEKEFGMAMMKSHELNDQVELGVLKVEITWPK